MTPAGIPSGKDNFTKYGITYRSNDRTTETANKHTDAKTSATSRKALGKSSAGKKSSLKGRVSSSSRNRSPGPSRLRNRQSARSPKDPVINGQKKAHFPALNIPPPLPLGAPPTSARSSDDSEHSSGSDILSQSDEVHNQTHSNRLKELRAYDNELEKMSQEMRKNKLRLSSKRVMERTASVDKYIPQKRSGKMVFSSDCIAEAKDGTKALPLRKEELLQLMKNPNEIDTICLEGIVVHDDALDTLIECLPNIQHVWIVGCPQLSYAGCLALKRLNQLQTLCLAKLPDVHEKELTLMMKSFWPKLCEIHLPGMPVSDQTLKNISALPVLKNLTLSLCPNVTCVGLNHFKSHKSLESLSLEYCPAIDPLYPDELRASRPNNFQLGYECADFSLRLPTMGEVEAREIILQGEKTLKWITQVKGGSPEQSVFEQEQRYWFLREITAYNTVFLQGDELTVDPNKATAFYQKKMHLIGIPFVVDPKESIEPQWLRADLYLQVYTSLSRVSWCIYNELRRIGFFTDSPNDTQKPPKTAFEIIQLVEKDKETYVRKITKLDFSNTGITVLPQFVLERNWHNLTEIDLRGTNVYTLPEEFRALCPKLEKVYLPGPNKVPGIEESKED